MPYREITALRRLHDLMSQVNASHDITHMLQTVVDGVADVAGFEVAAIRQLRPDGMLECVAVAGDDSARRQLLGSAVALTDVQAECDLAEQWGQLRFLPYDRLPENALEGWIPELDPPDSPDSWHPLDSLFVPLLDANREVSGLLSVDLPREGRRPGQLQRDLLEMYAVQAGLAIDNARERERLAEKVRLATAIRTVMETAGRGLDLAQLLDDSLEPLVTGFRCRGTWIRTFEGEGELPGRGRGVIYPRDTGLVPSDQQLATVRRIACDCWEQQRYLLLSPGTPAGDLLSDAEAQGLLEYVGRIGAHLALLTPLGAGSECLGYIALTRTADQPDWSQEEIDAALEIGRDLGRAVLHARLFEREREIVTELQRLDDYKTELIATVAHELGNPLTALVGHVELLEELQLPEAARRSVTALDRNTDRIRRLADDLLLLSKVGDANRPLIPVQVDLTALVHEAVELLRIQATHKDVTLRVVEPTEPVPACGERAELDRVVVNIVGNAVKYTPPGGTVTVSVFTDEDTVGFACHDDGLGISEADQGELFTEFFRSPDPEAQALPGTGLGLSIVKRIVDRHQGRLQVDSVLGEGSTFTVLLPRRAE